MSAPRTPGRKRLPPAAARAKLAGGRALAFAGALGALLVTTTPAFADDDQVAIEPAPLPPLPPPTVEPPPPPAPIVRPAPPPPAPAPACEEPCADPKKKPTRGSGYLGVRVQYTSAKGSTATREATGVAAAAGVEVYNDETGILASRSTLALAIGSGSGGVEGLVGGALMVGARARVTPNHGPFARIGLSGEYQGNSRYLYSRFDLPLGELGYQFVDGPTLFEVGGRLSPILTGRLRAGADQHVLNSAVSYGAFLSARGEIGRIEIVYTRQSLPLDLSPGAAPIVNTFQGRGCISPFSVFVACLEGQIAAGSRGVLGDDPAIATVGGILGFGAFGTKSRNDKP